MEIIDNKDKTMELSFDFIKENLNTIRDLRSRVDEVRNCQRCDLCSEHRYKIIIGETE